MVIAVACLPALVPTTGLVGVGPWVRCSTCGPQPVDRFWKKKTGKHARWRHECVALCKTCSPRKMKEWAHRTGFRRASLKRRRPASPDGVRFFCMGPCEEWLPRADFHVHRARKDGVVLLCKACESARHKAQRRLCECGQPRPCQVCPVQDGEGAAGVIVSALRQEGRATLTDLEHATGYTGRHILRTIAKNAGRFRRREETMANAGTVVYWSLA